MKNINFEFLHWVVDNAIPKVAAKSNTHYNKWIVMKNGLHPSYLTDDQLFKHWDKTVNAAVAPISIDLRASEVPERPTVGMGATISVGSDSYPYTIHRVDGKSVWASQDEFKRIDKNDYYAEQQVYKYSNTNHNKPDAWKEYVLRKNGRYVLRGKGLNEYSVTLHIGYRRAYQDPSF